MVEVAYRSVHPDVLAAVAKYSADMADWQERAAALLAEFGFEGRHFVVSTEFGVRTIRGVQYLSPETPPYGWRFAERTLKPNRRTGAGRAAAARIDGIRPPARPVLPGMPYWRLHGAGLVTHPEVAEVDGASWVRWPMAVAEKTGGDADAVDLTLWGRARLSEYHAATEAQEDRAAAS